MVRKGTVAKVLLAALVLAVGLLTSGVVGSPPGAGTDGPSAEFDAGDGTAAVPASGLTPASATVTTRPVAAPEADVGLRDGPR